MRAPETDKCSHAGFQGWYMQFACKAPSACMQGLALPFPHVQESRRRERVSAIQDHSKLSGNTGATLGTRCELRRRGKLQAVPMADPSPAGSNSHPTMPMMGSLPPAAQVRPETLLCRVPRSTLDSVSCFDRESATRKGARRACQGGKILEDKVEQPEGRIHVPSCFLGACCRARLSPCAR